MHDRHDDKGGECLIDLRIKGLMVHGAANQHDHI